MYCWKCGAQLPDGAKFCTECGADQRRAPQPVQSNVSQTQTQTTTAAAAAKPKKKANWLKRILIMLLAIAIGRGVGYLAGTGMANLVNHNNSSSSTGNTTISTPADLITMKKVLYEGESEGIQNYEVVYYGMNSKRITGITQVILASKSYGYTREYLEGFDYSTIMPAFAQIEVFDEVDYWCVRAVMDDLDTASRMQQLVDMGLMVLTDGANKVSSGGIDSEGYIQSILDAGGRYASTAETARLHLAS